MQTVLGIPTVQILVCIKETTSKDSLFKCKAKNTSVREDFSFWRNRPQAAVVLQNGTKKSLYKIPSFERIMFDPIFWD